MKIVIYERETLQVLEVIEGVEDVTFSADCLRWDTGELAGLKKPFLVLPDSSEVSADGKVSEDDIASGGLDESSSPEEQLQAENEALKERLQFLEEVTQEIIFSLYG